MSDNANRFEQRGKVAVLFPGQGSQAVGMLRSLRDGMPELASIVNELSPLFTNDSGEPVIKLIDCEKNSESESKLTQTNNAQPALGLMEAAVWSVLSRWGVKVDFVAGHSYGELPAVFAAGFIDVQTLAVLSRERGRLLSEAGRLAPGGLAAVMANESEVDKILSEANCGIEKANVNAPKQTVVGGRVENLERFISLCKDRGLRAILLKTACAFHTSSMEPVAAPWRNFLFNNANFGGGSGPCLFANVSANSAGNRDEVRDNLARQITSVVRFVELVQNLYAQGARIFIEAGPGKVLCGLVEKILEGKNDVTCFSFDSEGDDPVAHISMLKDAIARPSDTFRISSLQELAATNINVFKMYIEKAQEVTLVVAENLPHYEKTLAAENFMVESQRALSAFFEQQSKILLAGTGTGTGTKTRASQISPSKSESRALPAGKLTQTFETPVSKPLQPSNQNTVLTIKRDVADLAKESVEDAGSAVVESGEWLRRRIASHTGFPIEKVVFDKTFDSMGLDSISMIEILSSFLEAFPNYEPLKAKLYSVRTIKEIVDLAANQSSPAQNSNKSSGIVDHLMKNIESAFAAAASRASIPRDADLEKDIGVDTFTREEVFHDLLRNWPRLAFAGRELLHLRTLGAIEDLLRKLDVVEMVPELGVLLKTNTDRAKVQRFVLRDDSDHPLHGVEPHLPRRIILVAPYSLACEQLKTSFATLPCEFEAVVLKDAHWVFGDGMSVKQEEIDELGSQIRKHFDSLDGTMIVFSPIFDEDPFMSGNATAWNAQIGIAGTGFFRFAKALLGSGLSLKEAHLCVLGKDMCGPSWAATRGLIKSLGCEMPGIVTTSLCLEGALTDISPRKIIDALLVRKGHHGLRLDARGVRVRRFFWEEVSLSNEAKVLPPKPLFVLAGGGAGITAEFGMSLARLFPGCRIAAIGRTSLSGGDTDRERQIAKTRQRLQEAGAEFHYYVGDMSDPVSVAKCLQEIKSQHGSMSGFVHGAGLVDDSLIGRKSTESFQRVLQTKVGSLATLFKDLSQEPLAFVVLVSSLSSVSGTAGQTDYAAANDVFNECAFHWRNHTSVPVISMLWSVWNDVGLAGESIWKRMREMKLEGIAPQVGRDLFTSEILLSHQAPENVLFSPLNMLAFALGHDYEERHG